MGALLYTLTIIMLLATLTYSSLASYKTTHFRKIALTEKFMDKEREAQNNRVKKQRSYLVKKPKKKNNDDKDEKKEPQSYGKINIRLFINEEARDLDPQAHKEFSPLLSSLIDKLYYEEKFYQDLIEKRPYLIEQFIEGLKKSESLGYQIEFAKELAKIPFENEDLNLFSFKIFQEENQHACLLDYISHTTTSNKIALKSAKKELVSAIFDDDEAYFQIQNYIDELRSQELSPQEEQAAFKQYVMSNLNPILSEELMDFTISKK